MMKYDSRSWVRLEKPSSRCSLILTEIWANISIKPIWHFGKGTLLASPWLLDGESLIFNLLQIKNNQRKESIMVLPCWPFKIKLLPRLWRGIMKKKTQNKTKKHSRLWFLKNSCISRGLSRPSSIRVVRFCSAFWNKTKESFSYFRIVGPIVVVLTDPSVNNVITESSRQWVNGRCNRNHRTWLTCKLTNHHIEFLLAQNTCPINS